MTLPVFYYAVGTSWMFNSLGIQLTQDFSNIYVEFLGFTLGQPAPPIVFGNVKGLNGEYFFWNGDDVFPLLLDSTLWSYQRVPYPASAAFIGPSIEAGCNYVVNQVLATPPGTPFALGGYSQGAAVMARVLMETRNGRLADRRADLRAMVTFGSPMREAGHTFPNSSGYSGALDIPGDTSSGGGTFPSLLDFGLGDTFVRRFARLENTEDFVWDFTMPNEVISGVGDSPDGKLMVEFTKNSLRQIPIAVAPLIGRVMLDADSLWNTLGVAPPGVPQQDNKVKVIDPVTGEERILSGGGHIMYPLFPPPNADGSIPTEGDTCYQIAAKYLNTVGARIYDERNPTVVAPTSRAAYSWFTSLPGG